MIPVSNPIPEPPGFKEECETKGKKWLSKRRASGTPLPERPPDYWSPFRPALAEGFSNRCGYNGYDLPSGTVDHHVSWNENPDLAFEWGNYRFIEGAVNSSKGSVPSADLLDPFEVQAGWFEILLPSCQMVATAQLPPAYRQRAETTLTRLGLRDRENYVRCRRRWLEEYDTASVDERPGVLRVLDRRFPLLAQAIRAALAQGQTPPRWGLWG